MRLSQYFLPTLKETPSEAQIESHRLMLRTGMIRRSSSGIYSWLPVGLRVLRNIEGIVREEQNLAGGQELLMPTMQPADLWRESGRYDGYGKEMLRIKDRHNRDMLYGPTNEELITDIFRHSVKSYRELPLLLYHVQWKFRDEVRPRFGIMRGREFLMKDAYSFDISYQGARRSYNKMFVAYLRTFARMGLKAIPMAAETGPIGGELSHEFIILADTGESEVFCHSRYLDLDPLTENIDYDSDLQPIVDRWTELYAATDEKHDAENFANCVPLECRVNTRGIEVGHIFYFGTKYSEAMNAKIRADNGKDIPVEMGSYGIGVSRLVGAVIEANHDEKGIIWPEALAPFKISLINVKVDDTLTSKSCERLYSEMLENGLTVLYDDTCERPGVKFATNDLIGSPWQLVVGPRGLASGQVELRSRREGIREQISIDAAMSMLNR